MQPQRSVLGRLLSRWAQILFLSLLAFIPVSCLIYYFVEPTYEAFSILRVEPAQPKLYSDRGQDNVDFRSVVPYLQTQIKLMTSDRVLEPAVSSSSVAKLPVIAKSEDPKADLRKKLEVEIQEDSYLIRVALELPNGDHAAKIVNAVVDSYLSYNKDYKHGPTHNSRQTCNSSSRNFRTNSRPRMPSYKRCTRKALLRLTSPSSTSVVRKTVAMGRSRHSAASQPSKSKRSSTRW